MRTRPARLVLAARDGVKVRPRPGEDTPPPPPAAIVEFQPDAAEIEERAPPRLARSMLYMVALLITATVGWASIAKMDEIVVGEGKLVTPLPSLVVQPFETSVIRELKVKVGDRVRANQVLAVLDPTITSADSDQLRARLSGLDAQIARMEAEIDGRSYTPDGSDDAALQARIFAMRQGFRQAKLRDFDTQIARTETTLQGSRADAAILTKRIAGLAEIVTMYSDLVDRGSGSRLDYLRSRDSNLDASASLSRDESAIRAGEQTMAQLAATREAFIQDDLRETSEKLADLRLQRTATVEDLRKARLRQTMAVLRAPADSAVLDIAGRSVGSVVQPAEPLFTLVPLDVPLEAEVAVDGRDIGRLAIGAPARIKLDAFPFQKYGTLDSTVRVISEDAFVSDARGASLPAASGQPKAPAFYRIRLSIADLRLRNLPPDFHLVPGMSLQAEVRAGRRRVLSYFLYPLIRGFDESFHEP